jgi:hypothetical protein
MQVLEIPTEMPERNFLARFSVHLNGGQAVLDSLRDPPREGLPYARSRVHLRQ